MEKFADAVINIMESKISIADLLLYGVLPVLGIALIVCIIRDEPLAYYEKGGIQYKVCPRSGITEVGK